MKKLICESLVLAALAFSTASAYGSTWTGRFNKDISVLPCAGYSFVYKEVDSGICKPIWNLTETKDSVEHERLHVGYAQMWNVVHGNPAYMGTLGIVVGHLGTLIDFVNTNVIDLPDFAKTLSAYGTYFSVEGMGGYRPVGHRWDGALGGYLKIPIGYAPKQP